MDCRCGLSTVQCKVWSFFVRSVECGVECEMFGGKCGR